MKPRHNHTRDGLLLVLAITLLMLAIMAGRAITGVNPFIP